MKKLNKNSVKCAALIAALAATISAGGIMTYLTDTDSATNTFTVGRIELEQTEPNYYPDIPNHGDDGGTTKDILPNQVIPKDPTVSNVTTTGNPAYIFQTVMIPVRI